MSSKNISEKRKKIAKIIQPLWDSYQHMYTVRKSNTQNNINFLLIVVSFLAVMSITLYTYFKYDPFLFPILFQVAALLILFKSFFISGKIPWLELKEILKNLDDNDFEESLFATLKAAEDETYKELKEMGKLIKVSLYLILFSLYSTILAVNFIFFENTILYFLTIIITGVFAYLIYYYQKRPAFTFDDDYKRYKSEIKKWLEK